MTFYTQRDKKDQKAYEMARNNAQYACNMPRVTYGMHRSQSSLGASHIDE